MSRKWLVAQYRDRCCEEFVLGSTPRRFSLLSPQKRVFPVAYLPTQTMTDGGKWLILTTSAFSEPGFSTTVVVPVVRSLHCENLLIPEEHLRKTAEATKRRIARAFSFCLPSRHISMSELCASDKNQAVNDWWRIFDKLCWKFLGFFQPPSYGWFRTDTDTAPYNFWALRIMLEIDLSLLGRFSPAPSSTNPRTTAQTGLSDIWSCWEIVLLATPLLSCDSIAILCNSMTPILLHLSSITLEVAV